MNDTQGWAAPADIDMEIVPLLVAMNAMPGIKTTESCCGHGRRGISIWFRFDSLESLPALLYWFDSCHSGVDGWWCDVTTDCGMGPPTFAVHSTSKGEAAYEQSKRIAEHMAA